MPSSFKLSFYLFISFLCLHIASANIICENLPKEACAYAIEGSGKRCSLELYGEIEYRCSPSEIAVEKMANHIESERCIHACGLHRMTLGISSDKFLEPRFASKLCSPACFSNCPNIVDLYLNLAAREGAKLPDLCKAHRANRHRSMLEVRSSGPSPGPVSSEPSESLTLAPGPIDLESFGEALSPADVELLDLYLKLVDLSASQMADEASKVDGSPQADKESKSGGSPEADEPSKVDGSPEADKESKSGGGSPEAGEPSKVDGSPEADKESKSGGSPVADEPSKVDGSPEADKESKSGGSPEADKASDSGGSPTTDEESESGGAPTDDEASESGGTPLTNKDLMSGPF